MTVVAVMNAEGKIMLETMVPTAASRIPRRLRADHCVLWRRYSYIQGLPIPFPQQISCRRPIIGAVSEKARDRGIELIQEPG